MPHNSRTLTDPHNRHIDYVRVSVTDRCNLRCFYCLPKGERQFTAREDHLTYEEITRIMRAFTELGVKRIRITGGEPLARPKLSELIDQLSTLPNAQDLSISTNASLLSKQADDLYRAGAKRLNVSLDTLNPTRFKDITGNGNLNDVIDGLVAAKKTGFYPIKINMVAMKGINDDEFIDMVNFCAEHGFSLRFIETMPMGDPGRNASNHFLDLKHVLKKLKRHFKLIPSFMTGGGPARYFQIQNSDVHIGFITPISQHFCETCNRVRLSADGTLYLCLGKDHAYPLQPLIRSNASDAELKTAIIDALKLKPKQHEFKEKPEHVVRFMSYTGG